jgi:aryl-alcohol dehydrogenase-like predicted oxidoreductase
VPVLSFTSIAWGYFARILSGADCLYKDILDTPENLRRAEIVKKWSRETGMSPTAISVAYIASHPEINAAALVGCSKPEQVSDFLTAGDYALPMEFFDEINDGFLNGGAK